jgi:CRISPR-associated protein Cas2
MSSIRNSNFLYAYDVSDDKERRKVEKLLQGYGFRRQNSVFMCRLSRADRIRLDKAIESLALQTGFVLICRIAHDYVPQTIGSNITPDLDDDSCFIV